MKLQYLREFKRNEQGRHESYKQVKGNFLKGYENSKSIVEQM